MGARAGEETGGGDGEGAGAELGWDYRLILSEMIKGKQGCSPFCL